MHTFCFVKPSCIRIRFFFSQFAVKSIDIPLYTKLQFCCRFCKQWGSLTILAVSAVAYAMNAWMVSRSQLTWTTRYTVSTTTTSQFPCFVFFLSFQLFFHGILLCLHLPRSVTDWASWCCIIIYVKREHLMEMHKDECQLLCLLVSLSPLNICAFHKNDAFQKIRRKVNFWCCH